MCPVSGCRTSIHSKRALAYDEERNKKKNKITPTPQKRPGITISEEEEEKGFPSGTMNALPCSLASDGSQAIR